MKQVLITRASVLPRTWLAPGAVAVLAVAVLPILQGSSSMLDTGRILAIQSLIALSFGIAYSQAGILSMGQATFASIGAYATAIVSRDLGAPLWVGLVLAMALPATLSYLLAVVLVRLSPLALGLATLMMGEIVVHLLAAGGDLTGGYIGITAIPPLPFTFDATQTYLVLWAVVVAVVLLAARLHDSNEGRALRVVAHDRTLAASLGIASTYRQSIIFALCGAISGLAGYFYAHTTLYLAPESLPVLLSMTVVIMTFVGGKHHVLGPVVGAFVLTVVLDYLPKEAVQGLVYGGALALVLILFPRGVMGVRLPGRASRRRPGTRSADGGHSGSVGTGAPAASTDVPSVSGTAGGMR